MESRSSRSGHPSTIRSWAGISADISPSDSVSPQILRKTQSRLQTWQSWNKIFGRSRDSGTESLEAPVPLVPKATLEEPTGATFTLDYDEVDQERPSTSRFPLRRLGRTKTTANPSVDHQGVWRSAGDCVWRSSTGLEVCLTGTRLEHLSDLERMALQKVVLSRLLRANLGCAITKPKDSLLMGNKRQKYVKRKAHTVSVVEQKETAREKKSSSSSTKSLVFGIPISACIQNDLRVAELTEKDKNTQSRCKSLDLEEENLRVNNPSSNRLFRHSGESSKSSLSDQPSSTESGIALQPGDSSKASLDTQGSTEEVNKTSRYASSFENLLSSFSSQSSPSHTTHSSTPEATSPLSKQDSLEPHQLRVPKIVQSCCDYLQEYGLKTIGLFRIAGSVKRCRQMRLRLDSGEEFIFTEDVNDIFPHDIATLLKEYFRDLPNPLMTKELYSAYLVAGRLPDDRKVVILRYLVCLLPTANIDTLIVLMKFLQQVVGHSLDLINDDGVSISGNKMTAQNLATIFGPTILRPGSSKPHTLGDNDSVISVVQSLIENCDAIFSHFQVPKEMQNSIYTAMMETDPEALDMIMSRLEQNSRCQPSSDAPDDEEGMTTVYYTAQEEIFPQTITKEADGTTVIKTKSQTTHKIVYKIRKDTGSVVESKSLESDFPPNANLDKSAEAEQLGDNLSELKLFIDDTTTDQRDEERLIDLSSSRALKKPQNPMAKLGFSWTKSN